MKDINDNVNIKTDFSNLIFNNIKSDETNLGDKNKIKNILNAIPKINVNVSFELNQKNLMINDLDKNIKNYKLFEFIGKIQITPINKNYIQNLNKNENEIQTKIYNDGKYIGKFKNDLKEGKGIYYYNNNDSYEGEFKRDMKDGKGIFDYNNGNKYRVDFKYDKSEGKGICYYSNGNRYEGEWRADKIDGKAIFFWNDGDYYEGDFKNGIKDGKELYTYKSGNL